VFCISDVISVCLLLPRISIVVGYVSAGGRCGINVSLLVDRVAAAAV
jgi:hypothetical protein